MAIQQNIHIGQMIKTVFDNSGLSVSDFARRIHFERTTVYSIFERQTIDALLLVRISIVLNHNFLSDLEQHFGLTSQTSSFTIHFDHLSPEAAHQLADLLNVASD